MVAVFVGGRFDGKVFDADYVRNLGSGEFMEDYSERRAAGYLCHREELDGRPKVRGYAGPMWDGGRLRYESWDVYDMLCQ